MIIRLGLFLGILFCSLHAKNETRRITNGRVVMGNKRYVVYLLKAANVAPSVNYSSWTCGGAIIHPRFVVTAASCLHDLGRVYVINGYRKYVNADKMKFDPCIMRFRRRIVVSCYSKDSDPDKLYQHDRWNYGDIAIAGVDKPFDFHDTSYYKYCSYPPAAVRVNLVRDFALTEMDVVTYGWGHVSHYRPPDIDMDLNEPDLRYSSARTTHVKYCYDTYSKDNMSEFEDHHKYHFICVFTPGGMDENGILPDGEQFTNDCANKVTQTKIAGRSSNSTIKSCAVYQTQMLKLKEKDPHFIKSIGGFCQNDHGGPLVGYVGGHETLLGVACSFWLTKHMECRPPYMYTATRCMGKVIQCYLNPSKYRRSGSCDRKLSHFVERNHTWSDDDDDDDDLYW